MCLGWGMHHAYGWDHNAHGACVKCCFLLINWRHWSTRHFTVNYVPDHTGWARCRRGDVAWQVPHRECLYRKAVLYSYGSIGLISGALDDDWCTSLCRSRQQIHSRALTCLRPYSSPVGLCGTWRGIHARLRWVGPACRKVERDP